MLKFILIFLLLDNIFSNNINYGKPLEYKKEQIILYEKNNTTLKDEIRYFKEYEIYK